VKQLDRVVMLLLNSHNLDSTWLNSKQLPKLRGPQ